MEDNYPFLDDGEFEWRLPDAFEIRDHLQTVRRMGGQATRIYDISVLHPDDDPDLPRHVVDVPRDPDAQTTWLYDRWEQMDAWITVRPPTSGVARSGSRESASCDRAVRGRTEP